MPKVQYKMKSSNPQSLPSDWRLKITPSLFLDKAIVAVKLMEMLYKKQLLVSLYHDPSESNISYKSNVNSGKI